MTASLAHPPHAEPIIDERLTELMPALDAATYAELERAILRDGCTEPLSVWQERGVLLDGRHRLRICRSHGLPWSVVEISLPDEEAARAWVMERALARRNLAPRQVEYYRGTLYDRARKAHGDAQRLAKQDSPSGHGDHLGDSSLKTSESLASRLGVGEKTIRRNAEFARAVDELPAEARSAVLAGQVEGLRSAGDVVRAVREGPRPPATLAELRERAQAVQSTRKARSPRDASASQRPFRQFSVRKVELYTDAEDGQQYVDWLTLSCGCRVQAKRRMRHDAKRKALACPNHSGLRKAHERRIADRTLETNLGRAWAPERRPHLVAFIRHAFALLSLSPGDARCERIRDEMDREARLAGLYDAPETGQRGRGSMLAQHIEEE